MGTKIILICLITFAGCSTACQRGEKTKEAYGVKLLFDHEGCRVYSFNDDGYSRYFTNCSGSTSWVDSHLSGKVQTKTPSGVMGGK